MHRRFLLFIAWAHLQCLAADPLSLLRDDLTRCSESTPDTGNTENSQEAARGEQEWMQRDRQLASALLAVIPATADEERINPDWWKRAVPGSILEERPEVGEDAAAILSRSSSSKLDWFDIDSSLRSYLRSIATTKWGSDWNSIDLVVEFGGGSGSYALDVMKFGVKHFVIFDLPAMSSLQKYVVGKGGEKVLHYDELNSTMAEGWKQEGGLVTVTNAQDLEVLCSVASSWHGKAFVSHWALSETPLDVRRSIMSIVKNFEMFFITSQRFFPARNPYTSNREFFFGEFFDAVEEGDESGFTTVSWQTGRIMVGRHYFAGDIYMAGRRHRSDRLSWEGSLGNDSIVDPLFVNFNGVCGESSSAFSRRASEFCGFFEESLRQKCEDIVDSERERKCNTVKADEPAEKIQEVRLRLTRSGSWFITSEGEN